MRECRSHIGMSHKGELEYEKWNKVIVLVDYRYLLCLSIPLRLVSLSLASIRFIRLFQSRRTLGGCRETDAGQIAGETIRKCRF